MDHHKLVEVPPPPSDRRTIACAALEGELNQAAQHNNGLTTNVAEKNYWNTQSSVAKNSWPLHSRSGRNEKKRLGEPFAHRTEVS